MFRRLIMSACLSVVLAGSNGAANAGPITVRPGTYANGCTLDFLFTAGDGNRYIGTAGHCFVDDGQEQSWPAGDGPTVTAGGQEIGHAVYAVWNQSALNPLPVEGDPTLAQMDFALVRIDPSVASDPQVCHFGGPTGVNTDDASVATVVHYYGNGEGIGMIQETGTLVLPARTGIATGFEDARVLKLLGLISGGDSGMPIVDDEGRAVGLLSHLGSPVGSFPIPVSRLAPHVQRAEEVLGLTLTLQTARLTPNALPIGTDPCL
jgi:hypothetical protein